MNLFAEAKNVLDKDGKVNALGPYGKQKLTGREMSTYFRRNKVKDATIKKAVEVALDLGGADTIARKEIKKFYGDKVLKSKEVQQALQYANEAVSPAQQAAIAISKKEKGEKPLDEYAGKGGQGEGEVERRQRHIDDLKQKYRDADPVDRIDIKKKIKDLQNKLDDYSRSLNNEETIVESDMQNVDDAPKNKWKALGFSQHPHKGFEGERLPKSMRDFRKKAMTNTQKKKSLMATYKEMWEDGEKYAPSIEENMERSIMKKMRKGRVAKGMPR